MNYRYFNDDNFADYSSGRVIYHKTGMPNFPVRLAGEIFLRCLEYIDKKEITLYDPCCGSAYMITILGLLNIQTVKTIIASDISEDSINLSKSNLALLSENGITKRKNQIEQMIAEYKKPSHFEALESVNKFLDIVKGIDININVNIFQADVLAPNALINNDFIADIVITDVPYGNLTAWSDKSTNAVNTMLENLLPVISNKSVVAVITGKNQKVNNEKYKRMERFKAGKRQITILMVNK